MNPTVKNEHYAKPGDVAEAKKFLAQLPPACSQSSASAEPDGTIIIRIKCRNNKQAMDGLCKVKDGIITEIK